MRTKATKSVAVPMPVHIALPGAHGPAEHKAAIEGNIPYPDARDRLAPAEGRLPAGIGNDDRTAFDGTERTMHRRARRARAANRQVGGPGPHLPFSAGRRFGPSRTGVAASTERAAGWA